MSTPGPEDLCLPSTPRQLIHIMSPRATRTVTQGPACRDELHGQLLSAHYELGTLPVSSHLIPTLLLYPI